MAINARYCWRDDVPRASVQKLLRRSHAMVVSSRSEGGANVISEAIVAGVPILASRMDGNVGLLGTGYPGYFPVGDTEALARLLRRVETDPRFAAGPPRAIARPAPFLMPQLAGAGWLKPFAPLPPPTAFAPPRR